MLKIGLIKENKQPADKRAALTPDHCSLLMKRFPLQIEIWVESSADRVFNDDAYKKAGCLITKDISNCDVLFGVKEVPIAYLIPNKTYFLFSHTIKKQPYNREMLKAILKNNITLIDYEVLRNERGRILGFGTHAGIVGAYNGILTYGKKFNLFQLAPVYTLNFYEDLVAELSKIILPKIKLAVTGSGRVANGAVQLLKDVGITEVEKVAYLQTVVQQPVFIHLKPEDLFVRKDGEAYNKAHFHANHAAYDLPFGKIYSQTDLLINGLYWTDDMPRLFAKGDTLKPNFNISVIADLSCDIDGSVPITYKATTIKEPVIGWDKVTQKPCEPFSENSIDIMAVSNLPCELPADASSLFGDALVEYVIPELLKVKSDLLDNATITNAKGILTPKFNYLTDYINS